MGLDAYVKSSFGGVHALMLTPYKEDLSVDYDIYPEYVRWQESQGAHNLFAVCGSSEMGMLTLDERVKLARLTVENKGKTNVFATANMEPGWRGQLEELKRIEDTGVDGVVFVTKGYGNDDVQQLAYLSELLEHAHVPVMLYEFPGCKPQHLISAYVYGELVKTGRVCGIKDTTCRMKDIKEKIAVQGESCVMQANIPLLLEAYKAGARGVVATPITCGTKIFRRMWDAFAAGDMQAAEEEHANICLLDGALEGGFTATAKYLVSLMGVPMNSYTRTGKEISEAKAEALRTFYAWAKRHEVL